ncbi:SH3 domain-containing protein [Roseomonas elaeocarpi]|uniref:SH3 domain-containing protein n=1 Tax=Roseomonas elaeocarpi TaxID=907779 RepID=A0ABV6JPK4_9PROT
MHAQITARGMALCLLAVSGLALAGCNEKTADAAASTQQQKQAVQLAEAQLRADQELGRNLALREVRSFPQAEGDVLAVCGEMSIDGAQGHFVPFVSTVSLPADATGKPEVTSFLATSGVEATRVYVESTSRCRDMGGPRPTLRQAAPPLLPTIPADLPYLRQASFPAATPVAEAAAAPAASTGAEGSVVTRQAANLRSSPSGGSVLRVVAAGQSLKVYGTAPGGWYRVGDASGPGGWMHGSMVLQHP